ncbi:MAG: hypothetical protein ACNS60_01935 [Candidatus Cyclobacteriaceae bacterium M2_1C_046]
MRINLWVRTSIIFLLIATFLGAFLRYMFIDPISGVNFKYFLHAHSHVAFLGWIFNALYAGLLFCFIPETFDKIKKYNILFWCFMFSVLGMMFSFPLQGYAAVSITFSTLHVFLSWAFAFFFVRDTLLIYKKEKPLSLKFAYWSLAFLVISSLGPFALGYIMATGIEGPFYELAIYFYLHLQYDGWFTFAIFALIYNFLEQRNIHFDVKAGGIFLWIFALCCLPAYASSTLWASPPGFMYLAALVASLFQVVGIFYFWKSIKGIVKDLKSQVDQMVFWVMVFAITCFIFKNLLQLVGVEPQLAVLVYEVRNFLITYLHLVFIGFVTVFLLAWLRQFDFWRISPVIFALFILSFTISELLLVSQPLLIMNFGMVIPNYFIVLFIVSLVMPLVLLISVVQNFINRDVY